MCSAQCNINQIKKNASYITFMKGFFLGIIIFILIYGVKIINPQYDTWLLSGEDITQHYVGWLFYRRTPWQFPIGMIEGLAVPDKVSTIYMDCIPVMALLFKILSPILPDTFQYFGIWGILSFGLMGAFSSVLLKKYIKKDCLAIIGSVFFVVSPYVLQRMYNHTALAGQWIIIAALILWLHNPFKQKYVKKILAWCALAFLAPSIHMYFVPMIYVILIVCCIRDIWQDKKVVFSVILFMCAIITTLVTLFVFGAFSQSGGGLTLWGLGYYSANINTLFNSDTMEKILNALPKGEGQSEGMGYLGAGIIVLVIVAFYQLATTKDKLKKYGFDKKNFITGILCCAVFFVLALSPTVMFGDKILFTIKWPQFIMNILAIFRASGRFIWPICYLVMFGAIVVVFNELNDCKWEKIIFALFVCGIQLYDMSDTIASIHDKYSAAIMYDDVISTDTWEVLLEDKKHIVFIPYDVVYVDTRKTLKIGVQAYYSGTDINSFYMARINSELIQTHVVEYINELENGISYNDTIYVFHESKMVPENEYALIYYSIDGYIVGVSEENEQLEMMQNVEKINLQ